MTDDTTTGTTGPGGPAADALARWDAARGGADPADLKDAPALAEARALADTLLATGAGPQQLRALEVAAADPAAGRSKLARLGVKLALSRARLLGHDRPWHVSLVIPAYGENTRLKPRGTGPGADPLGEDFVVQKSLQLEWLFAGTAHSYLVSYVDDMSKPEPVTSGEAIAAAIAAADVPHARVLDLAEGVRTRAAGDDLVARALRRVGLPKNTRKAGAVYYGAAVAVAERGTADHAVVLTDCDLSVDAAQLGLLLDPLMSGAAAAAAGSRRLPESVLEIKPGRNVRANAARYFRLLLLPGLLPRDTQCGAKALTADAVAGVIDADPKVLDFSFDVELLTRVALAHGADRVVPVPVAWFDSSELTTTDDSVHFHLMAAQRTIALDVLPTTPGDLRDEVARVAGMLTGDEQVWLRFLERLAADPETLAGVERIDPDVLPKVEALIG